MKSTLETAALAFSDGVSGWTHGVCKTGGRYHGTRKDDFTGRDVCVHYLADRNARFGMPITGNE